MFYSDDYSHEDDWDTSDIMPDGITDEIVFSEEVTSEITSESIAIQEAELPDITTFAMTGFGSVASLMLVGYGVAWLVSLLRRA